MQKFLEKICEKNNAQIWKINTKKCKKDKHKNFRGNFFFFVKLPFIFPFFTSFLFKKNCKIL